MNKSLTLLVFLLLVQTVFTQELYLNTGKNFTSYIGSYKNPLLDSSNKIYNSGNSYEVGMLFNKNHSAISYAVGINLNEYNLSYAIPSTSVRYDWQTQYVGIQNSLVYDILNSGSRDNAVKIYTKLGLNSSFLVNGYQNANGIHYQIKDNEDYKKFIFQPFLGVQVVYSVSDECNINAGYQASIVNIGKDIGNTFNYFNQQIQFGISFPIN
jgi:hypothetical protein